jgi:putative methyltransferase (TIGR04325 family)
MIKDFIPPIFIKLFKLTREYKSYHQAFNKAKKGAYENKILCNVVAEKTNRFIRELNTKPYQLNATNVFLLATIQNYFNETKKKEIRIVDFGGACGIHYYEVLPFIPEDCIIKWTVIETNEMVNSAKKFRCGNHNLNFISDSDEVIGEVDLIYSSCALLYVKNPYLELDKLIKLSAKWILFNRMMFNEEDRDIYTLQKSKLSGNGPGKLPNEYMDVEMSYPHTTLSLPKFKKALSEFYNLEWEFEEKTGTHQINFEKVKGMGMFLKLKSK